MAYCINCGMKLDKIAKFCPNCGMAVYVAEPVTEAEEEKKIVQPEPEETAPCCEPEIKAEEETTQETKPEAVVEEKAEPEATAEEERKEPEAAAEEEKPEPEAAAEEKAEPEAVAAEEKTEPEKQEIPEESKIQEEPVKEEPFVYETVKEEKAPAYSPEYKPIGPMGYIGYEILYNIPIVGLVFILIFSFGGTKNINLRNYSRAQFIWLIIELVLTVALVALIASLGISLSDLIAY